MSSPVFVASLWGVESVTHEILACAEYRILVRQFGSQYRNPVWQKVPERRETVSACLEN